MTLHSHRKLESVMQGVSGREIRVFDDGSVEIDGDVTVTGSLTEAPPTLAGSSPPSVSQSEEQLVESTSGTRSPQS